MEDKLELVSGSNMTKIDRYGWKIQDKMGVQSYINKNQLQVDQSYQRTVSVKKVMNMARDWSWIACSSIVVAIRNSTFYVIDGQHRVMASMRRSDIVTLPCIVFESFDVETEAKGFIATNTQRKAMYASEKFKALLITGDEPAVIVKKLADYSGRTIETYGGANQISCISLMLKLAKTEPSRLMKIWPLVVDVCDGHVFHGRILEGLMYLEVNMNDGESLMNSNWSKRIKQIGYNMLLEASSRASSFYSRGGGKVWAYGFLEVINKNMRNKFSIKGSVD